MSQVEFDEQPSRTTQHLRMLEPSIFSTPLTMRWTSWRQSQVRRQPGAGLYVRPLGNSGENPDGLDAVTQVSSAAKWLSELSRWSGVNGGK